MDTDISKLEKNQSVTLVVNDEKYQGRFLKADSDYIYLKDTNYKNRFASLAVIGKEEIKRVKIL